MKGRPTLLHGKYSVRSMEEGDLPEILAVERRCFPLPWTAQAFRHELLQNPYARCLVVVGERGGLAGYSSVWVLDRQLLVNNLTVAPDHRRRGLGTAFLGHLLDLARAAGCTEALLEVRPSNRAGRRLYETLGFQQLAVRKRYYTDGEDALVLRRLLSGARGEAS